MYSPITTYLGGEESLISEVPKPKMMDRKRMIIRAVFILVLIAIVVMHVMMVRTLNNHSAELSTLNHRVSALESATGQPTGQIVMSDTPVATSVKSSFTPINYLNELNLFKSLPANEQHEYLNLSKKDKRARYPNALQ